MRNISIGIVLLCFTFINTKAWSQSVNASLTAKQYAYADSNTLVDLYFKIQTEQLRIRDFENQELIDINLSYRFNPKDSGLNHYGENLLVSFDTEELTNDYFLYKRTLILKPGKYQLQIFLDDANSDFEKTKFSTDYIVDNKRKEKISDVFFFESAEAAQKTHPLFKSGFAIYPKFQNGDYLFSTNDSILKYYVEYYDINNDEKLFIEKFIRPKGGAGGLKSTYSVKPFENTNKKVESKFINLSDLPSGNYLFTISIFTENKKSVCYKEVPFQRINKRKVNGNSEARKSDVIRNLFKKTLIKKYDLNDVHRLNQLIAAMALGEEKTERVTFYNAIDQPDLELKQNFFISYWEEKASFHPQTAIETFINTFDSVQRKFSFRKLDGYKTERGRVFLEYGKPDDIEKKSLDNRSSPFIIWHYYKLKNGQGNVIFVFKDANNTSDFELFHSNARGEVFNPNWRAVNESLNNGN